MADGYKPAGNETAQRVSELKKNLNAFGKTPVCGQSKNVKQSVKVKK